MRRAIAVIAFVLVISGDKSATACTCAGQVSPCAAYAGASAVFTGTVTRIESEKPVKDQQRQEEYGEQVAYVRVERTFKGVIGQEIVFHQPGHNCAPKFKVGARWLFYAHYHEKSKTWEVLGCGRSNQIENASDDLLYLYGLPQSATRTRISGVLKHYEDTPEKGFSLIRNISGARVRIVGEQKTYEMYTDQNGVYEIYDLPPGKYAVVPEIPFGLKVRFPMPFGPVDYSNRTEVTIELKANSCAGSNFVLSSYSSITGTVFGANGQVMPRVCLDLVPADGTPDHYFRIFDCTKADGRYELKEIPPGEYLIVVNKTGKITGDTPFGIAYYPGVFDKDKATGITVRLGDRLEKHDIQISSQALTSIVEGVLLFSDGRPVAKEFIDFKAEGDGNVERSARAVTDEQGRFSFRVLRGTAGWLRGYILAYRGKFLDCPYIDKLLEGRTNNMIDVEAKQIRIEVSDDIRNVKVVFQFPFCAGARPR